MRISGKVSSVTDTHSMCPTPLSRARWSTSSRPAFRGSKLRWQWESTSSVTYIIFYRGERREKSWTFSVSSAVKTHNLHGMRQAVGIERPGEDAFEIVARDARILLAELDADARGT